MLPLQAHNGSKIGRALRHTHGGDCGRGVEGLPGAGNRFALTLASCALAEPDGGADVAENEVQDDVGH